MVVRGLSLGIGEVLVGVLSGTVESYFWIVVNMSFSNISSNNNTSSSNRNTTGRSSNKDTSSSNSDNTYICSSNNDVIVFILKRTINSIFVMM